MQTYSHHPVMHPHHGIYFKKYVYKKHTRYHSISFLFLIILFQFRLVLECPIGCGITNNCSEKCPICQSNLWISETSISLTDYIMILLEPKKFFFVASITEILKEIFLKRKDILFQINNYCNYKHVQLGKEKYIKLNKIHFRI